MAYISFTYGLVKLIAVVSNLKISKSKVSHELKYFRVVFNDFLYMSMVSEEHRAERRIPYAE